MRKYDNILKITIGQGDDYTTGCLLDYPCFKENYKLIAIDLSKQQAVDADQKATWQINFIENLGRSGQTTIFFVFEEGKENIWDFSQGTVRVLWVYFDLIIKWLNIPL